MIDARHLVDYASDAAFAVDGDMSIVAWNYGARRLLGYTRREVLGRHCSKVLQATLPGGEPLCGPDCSGAQCFRNFRAFNASACRTRHKDGAWVSVNLSTVVMPKRARPSDPRSAIAVVMLQADGKEESQSLPEAPLHIFTLGRFGLAARGRRLVVENWKRKQALTLLKYLAANLGRAIHREILIEHLWPEAEESHGRERLKVTVYFLRNQFRDAGIREDVVVTAGKTYTLAREAVWVDREAFEDCVAKGFERQRLGQWDQALDEYEQAQHLYRGDYMEEDVYADWCAEERERLREIYLEALAGIVDCHAERGHFAEAVQVCRTALVRDPCRESFHRSLMEYLVRLGRTDWAIAQYQNCRRILGRELGVEPMPETQRLYRQIIDGDGDTPADGLTGRLGE